MRAPTDAERQLIRIHELLDEADVPREIPGIGTLAAPERLVVLLNSMEGDFAVKAEGKRPIWTGPWIDPYAQIHDTVEDAIAAGIDPDDLAPWEEGD